MSLALDRAETRETDVLVIGAGAAGLRAALAAREAGARVLLANKGRIGVSGATAVGLASSAGFAIPDGAGDPLDSPDVHYDDIMTAAQGCADPRLVRILVDEAASAGADLDRWRVPFITDQATGRPLIAQGDFASRPRNRKIYHHGKPIAVALRRECAKAGVEFIEHAMVLTLHTSDEGAEGALLMTKDGTLVDIRARVVVVTTGGAGQLFRYSLMPADITGDGYALGYRAGARMANMEFMQAGFGTIKPALNIIMAWFWAVNPRFTDRFGEDVIQPHLPPGVSFADAVKDKARHYPFSASDRSRWIEIAARLAIDAGRAADLDGFYLDLRHVDGSKLTEKGYSQLWAVSREWLLRKNMDITKEPLHVGLMGHAINGGMIIDEHARTTVPGLLAAGEAATGPYGADRLGGNMLLNCLVFGNRAGLAAAEAARARAGGRGAEARLADALAGLRRRSEGQGAPIRRSHEAIKKTMSDNALIIRTEQGLKMAEEVLMAEHERLDAGAYAARTVRDLWRVYEAENLIDVGLMMVTAAAMRDETRGSHYRADAPEKKPHWDRSIVIDRRDGLPALSVEKLGPAEAA
ncbi:FAD-binding protein [Cereibacter azotoformans]|uniref:FAD-binding protein n=1 Tax=Cereibacter azotoformans TaxID=43057 RepID=UPI003B20D8B7